MKKPGGAVTQSEVAPLEQESAAEEAPADNSIVEVSFTSAGGVGKRKRVSTNVQGRALLGPAVFPVGGPQLFRGETLRLVKGRWLIDRTKIPKRAR